MKKVFFNFFLVILFISSTKAQWTLLPFFTEKSLNSVFFTDANNGYIVGDSGLIYKTIDGGLNWFPQVSGTGNMLKSVYFPTPNIGYAVGIWGTILKTLDAGETWSPQYSGNNYNIVSVHFTDAYNGCAVGWDTYNGVSIITTNNGGSSWTSHVQVGNLLSLNSVFFTNQNTGFATGPMANSFIKTTDGGTTWNLVTPFPGSFLKDVFFPTIDTGYVLGAGTYKTTNGGQTWTVANSSNGGLAMYFTNSNIGYVAGAHGIITKTVNGGLNWVNQLPFCDTGSNNGLNSVHFPTTNIGFVVGQSGIILKTTNGGGLGQAENDLQKEISIYPNPFVDMISINISVTYPIHDCFISIYNIQGQLLFQQTLLKDKTEINISNLDKGIYFLRVSNVAINVVRKIIKE
jgi:photosystem II stability/assembly factor-like uncharacterized protein